MQEPLDKLVDEGWASNREGPRSAMENRQRKQGVFGGIIRLWRSRAHFRAYFQRIWSG